MIFRSQEVTGEATGDLLVISWGGTYGACTTAVRHLQARGKAVSHAHLRYLNPFPRNFGELLRGFEQVLVPELNMGQLRMMLRAKYPGRCSRTQQGPGQAVLGRRNRGSSPDDVG